MKGEMNKGKITLYEIYDKRLNAKIVLPQKDYERLNIVIGEGQIWINLKRNKMKKINNKC